MKKGFWKVGARNKSRVGLSLPAIVLVMNTIYRHIWKDKSSGGSLYKHLRHSGKKYNKRSSVAAGWGHIPNRVDIDERPKIVEQKTRIGNWELGIGYWESDTIIGAKHQGAIVSLVDRCSKFTVLKKIDRKTAKAFTKAAVEKLGGLSLLLLVITITLDNGKEFADHVTIADKLGAKVYFAKPYHAWDCGLNEHTNGLIRQYLRKSTDFTEVSDKMAQEIEDKLNNRPRKILGYKTPMEVMMMHQNMH